MASLQHAISRLNQRQPDSPASRSSSWTASSGAELAALARLALTGQLDAAELAVVRECSFHCCRLHFMLLQAPSGMSLAGSSACVHPSSVSAPPSPCPGWTDELVMP